LFKTNKTAVIEGIVEIDLRVNKKMSRDEILRGRHPYGSEPILHANKNLIDDEVSGS